MAKNSALRKVELSVPAGQPEPSPPLRLDIGCGKTTPDGWIGVDKLDFGQAWRADLSRERWAFVSKERPTYAVDPLGGYLSETLRPGFGDHVFELPDSSVDEVRSSHFVEHLTGAERIAFFNELWRVMKNGATAQIITPNWSHACAYGDPTHQWPPMSSWYALYLHKEWRAANAPHVPYTCHFDHVVAASWDGKLATRNDEYRSYAMDNFTNSFRDLIVNLTCRK